MDFVQDAPHQLAMKLHSKTLNLGRHRSSLPCWHSWNQNMAAVPVYPKMGPNLAKMMIDLHYYPLMVSRILFSSFYRWTKKRSERLNDLSSTLSPVNVKEMAGPRDRCHSCGRADLHLRQRRKSGPEEWPWHAPLSPPHFSSCYVYWHYLFHDFFLMTLCAFWGQIRVFIVLSTPAAHHKA